MANYVDMWTGTWANAWGVDNTAEVNFEEYYDTKVEIYVDTAFGTLMDIINARTEPTTLSELKGHGAGSFKVSKLDPKIATNPNLLAFRNYVKIRQNGVVIGGFIIQTKKTVLIGSGEETDEAWEISGEGPRSWSRDASVYPPGGLKLNSAEDRYFNFATERGSWYNNEDWPAAVSMAKWNSPGNWWGTAPADWPDAPNAFWVWSSNPAPGTTHPTGYNYFRHEFTVETTGQYSLFVAMDNSGEVFVDGEQLMTASDPAWQETNRVDFTAQAGSHVIGIKVYNSNVNAGWLNPGALLAALFRVGDASGPTAASLVSYTGQNTWRVNGYPTIEPGWSIGDVLLTLMNEAKARGVRFAQNFTPMFNADTDSNGAPWADAISWSFSVGSTYESVFEAVEELGCDIFIDPDTLNMYVWRKRGTDRSIAGIANMQTNASAIIFSPGHNLVAADETGQAEIANTLMIRTAEGWAEKTPEDLTSKNKFGRVETQMSTQLTAGGVAPLVEELFRQKALPEVAATFDIVPVPGIIPFVDFGVGDYVSAPGEVPGVMESRRVMSIAFTEDSATGRPVYALEFDTIFKDRQSELEKWISRLANSSAIGGGFTNSSNLPPTTNHVGPGGSIGGVPDPPTGLTVSSLGKYHEDGSSSSDYGLTWNTVTTSAGFGTVQVTHYEVYGRLLSEPESQQIATVFDTMAYLTGYRPGDTWVFKVRAVSRTGGPGNFSPEVALKADPPLIPLKTPSAPILTSRQGLVTVKWDGLLGGVLAPRYVRYLRVERAASASGPWTAIGSLVNFQIQDLPGTPGTTAFYRFVAVDGYGNVSTASAVSSIVVVGTNSGEITGGLATNNLVANGSFEDGMSPFWTPLVNRTGSTIQVVTVSTGSGGLAGAKYLRFVRGAEAEDLPDISATQTLPYYIPISAVGSQGYFVSLKANSSSTPRGAVYARVDWYLADKVTPASTPSSPAIPYSELTSTAAFKIGQVFPPANARFMRVVILSGVPGTTVNVDDVVVREIVTADMLGENSVTAVHMSAGSVTANALQANSVNADALAAGSVIADKVAAGAIQVSHLAANVGESLDISSNNSVNILIERAGNIETDLGETKDTVTSLTTHYSFGPDGAIIGKNDSPFKLMLANDRIEMTENGNVLAYWNSGQMHVDQFVGKTVTLGNHQLEQFGTDGTVVRAI